MIRRKFRDLIKNIFAQGISPRKLALTISLGIFIGTVPLLWGSTLICAVVAVLFRLNQPSIQAANYLVYPVQLALIIPFYRMGAGMFPWGPPVSLDIVSKVNMAEWMGNIIPIIAATFKALAAWFLIVAPLAVVLYLLLWIIFTRLPGFNNESGNDKK